MNLRSLRGLVWVAALAGVQAVAAQEQLRISSPAFANGAAIPAKYARAQENLSPPLRIAGVPGGTKSLALLMEDPDAPGGLFTHWVVWDLPPNTTSIPEGKLPTQARQGVNSFGENHYDGPAPPSGTHRYLYRLYAINIKPPISPRATRAELLAAIQDHVLATAEFMGTYSAGG